MLKRILIIAFFTGSGQLLSVFVLKFLAGYSSIEQLRAIAEIDSLVLFIMNLIAMGLQAAAMRNLALAADWKQEYYETQSARITLGMLLMGAAALAFLNEFYVLFLVAPVLAWSGDYALYARGYPVTGSVIAFVRLAVPFMALLAGAFYYPDGLGWIYALSLTLVYFLTNAYISYFLGTAYIFKPSFKSLRLYISSLPLGVVALSLYFLGLGLILIVPYLYSPEVVAAAFLGLKLYVIFKGVLRIIHQAFIKEMQRHEVCFKVDQLCSLIGLAFVSFMVCFPGTCIRVFFGEQYIPYKTYFILLSVAALIYSLFSSLTTRAMLEKRDRPYAITASVAALCAMALCVVFSWTWPTVTAIGTSLLTGEIIFAGGMLWMMNKPVILSERIVFLLKNLPLVAIPLAIAYVAGDRLTAFIIAAVVLCGALAAIYHNKFNIPPGEH